MNGLDRLRSFAGEGWRKLGGAFRWWLAELAALVPLSLRQRFSGADARYVVHIGGTEAVVRDTRAGNGPNSRSVSLADVGEPVPGEVPAVVCLSVDEIFVDRFQLPGHAGGKLREILAFEVERRSPFRGQNALFDFAVTGRDDGNRLNIEWALAPAEAVQRAHNIARHLGFLPLKIGLEGEAPGQLRYVFMEESSRKAFRLTPAGIGVAAAAGFFLCALAYAVISPLAQGAALAQALASVKAEAKGAGDIKRKVETTADAVSYLVERANEAGASMILAEVTRVLPDDAWVTSLEIRGREVRLIGYSAAASSLIEKLSGVPLFEKPHFRAAITPETNRKSERFDIAFTLRGRSGPGATP